MPKSQSTKDVNNSRVRYKCVNNGNGKLVFGEPAISLERPQVFGKKGHTHNPAQIVINAPGHSNAMESASVNHTTYHPYSYVGRRQQMQCPTPSLSPPDINQSTHLEAAAPVVKRKRGRPSKSETNYNRLPKGSEKPARPHRNQEATTTPNNDSEVVFLGFNSRHNYESKDVRPAQYETKPEQLLPNSRDSTSDESWERLIRLVEEFNRTHDSQGRPLNTASLIAQNSTSAKSDSNAYGNMEANRPILESGNPASHDSVLVAQPAYEYTGQLLPDPGNNAQLLHCSDEEWHWPNLDFNSKSSSDLDIDPRNTANVMAHNSASVMTDVKAYGNMEANELIPESGNKANHNSIPAVHLAHEHTMTDQLLLGFGNNIQQPFPHSEGIFSAVPDFGNAASPIAHNYTSDTDMVDAVRDIEAEQSLPWSRNTRKPASATPPKYVNPRDTYKDPSIASDASSLDPDFGNRIFQTTANAPLWWNPLANPKDAESSSILTLIDLDANTAGTMLEDSKRCSRDDVTGLRNPSVNPFMGW